MATDLGDILEETAANDENTEESVEPKGSEDPVIEVSDDTGDDETDGEGDEGGELLDDDEPNEVRGLKAALAASREKRRASDLTVSELKGRLGAVEQFLTSQVGPQADPAAEAEANDALLARFSDNPKQVITEVATGIATQMRNEAQIEELKEKHEDYAEVEKAFLDAASADKTLISQMNSQRNPMKWAFRKGRELLEFKNMGAKDLADYKKKLEAQIRAELKGDGSSDADSKADAVNKVPKSTAGARGGPTKKTPAFTGPTPLSKLLPG